VRSAEMDADLGSPLVRWPGVGLHASIRRIGRSRVTVRPDRRLVAVMFTDMVGVHRDDAGRERLALDKRAQYTRALETHHDAGGGTIVQRLGDGRLSMFPNAIDAVLAAVRIQQELTAQDVPVRIGIHLGEVIVEPPGLVGDAVNIASRIESFAGPGSVMLSDAVHDQIKNRTEVAFAPLGFRLKNVGRRAGEHHR
jgi:adenylate cyclase